VGGVVVLLLPLLLDVFLLLLVVGAITRGAAAGFLFTVGSIIGAAVGAVFAFFLIPPITTWIPEPTWRATAVFLAIVMFVVGGLSLGERLGHLWRKGVARRARPLDRVGGALAGGAVSLLVMSLVGSTVTALGIPLVSPTTANSNVLRSIEQFMPGPVSSALGQVRSFVVREGIPRIADALGDVAPPPPPVIDAQNPDLRRAGQSVGRITGSAYACGQVQSGSAFVVAPDRLLTNAHVLAGVTEPTIEFPGIGGLAGRVVYFDGQQDIALVAVDGLPVPPLATGATLGVGAVAAVQGYPWGGPFVSGGAEVVQVGTLSSPTIDGAGPFPRDTYTLAADVNPGNSGGPLLALDGSVAGMVFAKAQNREGVGYAHTMVELAPVINSALQLTESVSTGSCSR
jgi:S1-C subfamily serine protease